MVKIFSTLESEQITKAIGLAEQRTCAEITAVVVPRSDHYIAEMMLYGFVFGSLINFVLWEITGLNKFPLFFLIQLLCMFLVPFIPGLNRVLLYLLPRKLLFHRASHLGAEEILALTKAVSHEIPVVLLFISIAEHYVHILPNHRVANKVDEKSWDPIINGFILTLKRENLTKACTETIKEIATLLEPIFPEDAGKNLYEDEVRHGSK
ncbi:hypothetical protein [Legionella sp. PC997]|uniref:hypothetical protein n=1 Tax=Legionella sp. PC997 TaxID=2755562 RepID=UPI0015F83F98|nr:hypothetical protein [Legionella sp. PC997]QMT61679.1 hypothetical protein HBNCFIEN_03083 [Legionella sp. PC997]